MASNTRENKVTNCFKITGRLLHDNKLFDRTCVNCRGMYSSYIHKQCPKCGGPLTFITTKKGTPLAISEGTISMSLGEETRKRVNDNISHGPYVGSEYRFKILSFGDENGNLAPPPDHKNFRKGSIVEALILNHPPEYKPFNTGNGSIKIEVMLLIYTNYGDYVKILKQPEIAESTVSTPVKQPVNTKPNQDKIKSIETELTELRKMFQSFMSKMNGDQQVQNSSMMGPDSPVDYTEDMNGWSEDEEPWPTDDDVPF